MAFNHIYFNQSTQYGSKLRSLLNKMEQSDDEFADLRDVMVQMRDGDGSQNVHYAEVTKRFGFGDYDVTVGGAPTDAQNAKARAAFEELDSAFSKTSGNGSVTNVRAARDQVFAKLRG
jgi:hypothetical protein